MTERRGRVLHGAPVAPPWSRTQRAILIRIGTERYDLQRLRSAVRRASNWLQLVRFAAVGATGYVVNLVTFAVAIHVVGLDYRLAASLAFLIAVTNNYHWNRQWTFEGTQAALFFQAARFLAVSLTAFVFGLAILAVAVDAFGLGPVLGQAIAIAIATPVNFIGNKVWTFSFARGHVR